MLGNQGLFEFIECFLDIKSIAEFLILNQKILILFERLTEHNPLPHRVALADAISQLLAYNTKEKFLGNLIYSLID